MTTNDMKKLSRTDLLEMLIEQSTEVQALREKVSELELALQEKEAMLQKRDMAINEAGSIAEAALQLSGIFEAAETASHDYMENIRKLSTRQQEVCRQREKESLECAEQCIKDAQARCLEMETDVKKRCKAMEIETKIRCEGMVEDAQRESRRYWDELARYMETYCNENEDLLELFSAVQTKTGTELEYEETGKERDT